MDTAGRLLSPHWTCAHLRVGEAPGESARFFARCVLGDERTRLAWVAEVRAERMAAIQRLAQDFAQRLSPLVVELWHAKSRQIDATGKPGRQREIATEELGQQAARLLKALDEMIEEGSAELEAAGFPSTAIRPLVTAGLEDFVGRATPESHWRPPAELLAPIPLELRRFFDGMYSAPPEHRTQQE